MNTYITTWRDHVSANLHKIESELAIAQANLHKIELEREEANNELKLINQVESTANWHATMFKAAGA
jgi:uncharacterized protein (DUF3084 family)